MTWLSGCSSVLVECLNGVQEAAGSTPVTRTRKQIHDNKPKIDRLVIVVFAVYVYIFSLFAHLK